MITVSFQFLCVFLKWFFVGYSYAPDYPELVIERWGTAPLSFVQSKDGGPSTGAFMMDVSSKTFGKGMCHLKLDQINQIFFLHHISSIL